MRDRLTDRADPIPGIVTKRYINQVRVQERRRSELMSVIQRYWTVQAAEVRVLVAEGVVEKYEDHPPGWYREMFSDDQRLQIQNVIKQARKLRSENDKSAIDFINSQKPWLKEALIVMIEEEIKFTGGRAGK